MEIKWMPLVIGGFLPAFLYGIAGIFQKWSARSAGTVSIYLIGFGLATFLVGWLMRWLLAESGSTAHAFGFAFAGGASFAVGAALISLALIRFNASIAQLSPLYNTNLLVTVGLGLTIFGESRNLNVGRLMAGALLIGIGALLVTRA